MDEKPIKINKLGSLMVLAIMLWAPVIVLAGNVEVWEGYTFDVAKERNIIVEEISLVTPPKEEPPIKEAIFDSRLTREFSTRYEQEFGKTSIERNADAHNSFAEREYSAGVFVSLEEDQRRKGVFGDYLIKRLVEHHVDNYVKSNPKVRPIYELKDRISNVKLEVRKGYRVKLRYNYSGNYLDINIDNPYDVKTNLTLEMDPDSFGPSDVVETRIFFSYPVKKNLSVASDYTFDDGIWVLSGYKSLSSNMVASITGKTYTNGTGKSGRDRRILFGITWSN